METEVIYKLKEEDFRTVVREELSSVIINRFSDTLVTSETVCDLLKVNIRTITNYVNREKLHPVNPGSSKYLFRLSEILNSINIKYRHE